MPELALPQETILGLRAQAHALNAVVLLGAAGLSEPALKEIDRALSAHGLIKVKAGRLERADRDAMFLTMAERLHAARIQVIGHTFVLFRPLPDKPPAKAAAKKSTQKTGTRATKSPARKPSTFASEAGRKRSDAPRRARGSQR
jgi:putative YhbY family RNA-binding protein